VQVLFGWLSDAFLRSGQAGRHGRLPVIRLGGACWALAFYLAWFPWGGEGGGESGDSVRPWVAGLNWAVNLCVYDAMLTLVEVGFGAQQTIHFDWLISELMFWSAANHPL
jgi:hypothetical protein